MKASALGEPLTDGVADDGRPAPLSGLLTGRSTGVALVAALLLVWEASARSGFVQSVNWPPFSRVLGTLFDDCLNGDLLSVMMSTFLRMGEGYVIGCAIAVPLGFLLALSKAARITLLPVLEILRPIPIPAVIPPLIFIFGLDDALKVFSVVFAVLFPVTLNTVAGINAIEPTYRDVATTFGIPARVTLSRVIFPAALPLIFAGLRISLALALVVTVVSEMIAGDQGIGYYIMSMEFAMRAGDMYAAVILLALIAYVLNYGFIRLESRALGWARLQEARRTGAK